MERERVTFVPESVKVNVYEFDNGASVFGRIVAQHNLPGKFCAFESNIFPFINIEDPAFVLYDLLTEVEKELELEFGDNESDEEEKKRIYDLIAQNFLDVDMVFDTFLDVFRHLVAAAESLRRVSYPNEILSYKFLYNLFIEDNIAATSSLVADEYEEAGLAIVNYISDIMEKLYKERSVYENLGPDIVPVDYLRNAESELVDNNLRSLYVSGHSQIYQEEQFTLKHVTYTVKLSFPVGTRLLEIFDAINISTFLPYVKVVYQRKIHHKIISDDPNPKYVKFDNTQDEDGIYFVAALGSGALQKCRLVRSQQFSGITFHVDPIIIPTQGNDETPAMIKAFIQEMFGHRIKFGFVKDPYQSSVKGCVVYEKINFDPTIFAYMIESVPFLRYMFFIRDFGYGSAYTNVNPRKNKRNDTQKLTLHYNPDHKYDLLNTETRIVISYSAKHPTQIMADIRSNFSKEQIGGFTVLFDSVLRYYERNFNTYTTYFTAFDNKLVFTRTKQQTAKISKKSGETLLRLQELRSNLFGGKKEGFTCKSSNKLSRGQFFSLKCQSNKNRQPWLLQSREELNEFLEKNYKALRVEKEYAKLPVGILKQLLFYNYVFPYPKDGMTVIPSNLIYSDTTYDNITDWYICPKHGKDKSVLKSGGMPNVDKDMFPNTIAHDLPGAFPKSFPCCFAKKSRNQSRFLTPPEVLTDAVYQKRNKRERLEERAVQISGYWYIHPKVNVPSEPQTPQSDSMVQVSTDYIFNSKKLLQERRKGHIPLNMSNMFKTFLMEDEIKHPGAHKTRTLGEFTTFRRIGVHESASSFFIAVRNSLPHVSGFSFESGGLGDPENYADFADYIKGKISEKRIDAAMQSIYDKSKVELLKMCDHKHVYKDPKIWAPIFEEIFERNIFLFKIDDAVTPDGDIVIPRHKSFYVNKELWYRKSIIIIMDRINGKSFPFQCEFVIDEISANEVKSDFDSNINKYRRLTDSLIKYLILRNDFKLITKKSSSVSVSSSARPISSSATSKPTTSKPTTSTPTSTITIVDSEDEDSNTPEPYNPSTLKEKERSVKQLNFVLREYGVDDVVLRGQSNNVVYKQSIINRLAGNSSDSITDNWLDDNIVFYTIQEIYMSLVFEVRNEIACSNSPILSDGNLRKTGPDKSPLISILDKYGSNIPDLKKQLGMQVVGLNNTGRSLDWTNERVKTIITPFNLHENHWILVKIDKPQNEGDKFIISVYDSIKGDLGVYNKLKNVFTRLLILLFKINMKRVEFNIVPGLPKQSDTKNCGIFTLLFANAILRKREPITSDDFVTESSHLLDLRWRIAVRLLKHKVPLT
jgi:hypothetical protein